MDGNNAEITASHASPSAEGDLRQEPVSSDIGGKPLDGLEQIALQDIVVEALRTCYDPEIPVNIYELGLVYEVKVEPSGEVHISMTLTSPNCPAAASLPAEVQEKVKGLPKVTGVKLEVVWEPPWDPSRMTEAAKLQLGMF